MPSLTNGVVSILSKVSDVFDARLIDFSPKYFAKNIIKKTNNNRYPASLVAEK